MKIQQTIILLATIVILSTGAARAQQHNIEILGDTKLATIRGGFCIHDECETGAPSGNCQPLADTIPALCAGTTCALQLGTFGRGSDSIQCVETGGNTTCTEAGMYKECVQVQQISICLPGTDPTCGFKAESYCFPDVKNRVCHCSIQSAVQNCDWASCVN
jgi:hypothetical protein